MTEPPPNVGPHPDPSLIAAHAERRLMVAEAARLDEHIATCSTCYDVFAETVRFVLNEEENEDETVSHSKRPAPSLGRRPVFRWAAGLAAAAAIVVAVHQVWLSRSATAARPLVAELAQAMGAHRFVEPRLTGGFQHGRLIVLRSGDAPQGLDAHAPAVLAAVARIRERAEGDTSPAALGAVGITYLVSGDIGAAVKALESAAQQDPKNARLQSDLAAAYLVRAGRLDEPADLPKALEAAEKAVEEPDAPLEAYYNRALALQSLHLDDAARKAWEDYLNRDASSGWADEARRHIERLAAKPRVSIEQDRTRVRAALEEGPAGIERLADEAPSQLREYFENELLSAWAEAHLAGTPDAERLRQQADVIGAALLRTTSDALPRDAAAALVVDPGSGRDPPGLQARGYRALHEAQRLYEVQQPSCETFREARRLLESGGSPYALWARERIVSSCLYPTQPRPAIAELIRVGTAATERRYGRLKGRIELVRGLFLGHAGEFAEQAESYRTARVDLHAAREIEEEAYVAVLLAENLREAGETRTAWQERHVGLSLLGGVRSLRREQNMLTEAVYACDLQGQRRSAHHFATAVVETATRWSNPVSISFALLSRAAVRNALGRPDLVASDLAGARRLLPRIGDRAVSTRMSAEIDALEGEILSRSQPARAAGFLGRSVAYFKLVSPVRMPRLLLHLARAHAAERASDEAEGHLETGIRELERQSATLGNSATAQAAFSEVAFPLLEEMIRLQLEGRHDAGRALAVVERGRTLELGAASQVDRHIASSPTLEVLQRGLADGVALVYYLCLEDRLLTWLLTRDEMRWVEQPLPADEVRRLVAAHEAALTWRAPSGALREHSARLFDLLLRPLLPWLGRRVIIVVPDDVVQSVAFAGLWNRDAGRFLVEDHMVGLAPSGAALVRASASASNALPERAPKLLAIGNPRFDRARWPGFSSLPDAEREAAEIAGLYEHSELLVGSEATHSGFLDRLRDASVVHFAGHAMGSDARGTVRLLLAPDAGHVGSGTLSAHELSGIATPRTRLVVLAACRTAAGSVSGVAGALGLARPIIAAGVPTVVGSLWDVDDRVSRRFFVAFHRVLLQAHDPLIALRRTQVEMLQEADPALAHPASWAGFVATGGVDSRALLAHAETSKPRVGAPTPAARSTPEGN